mgnify:CR=1 FL=1
MSSSELLEAYEAAVASTPEATACEPLLKALQTMRSLELAPRAGREVELDSLRYSHHLFSKLFSVFFSQTSCGSRQ